MRVRNELVRVLTQRRPADTTGFRDPEPPRFSRFATKRITAPVDSIVQQLKPLSNGSRNLSWTPEPDGGVRVEANEQRCVSRTATLPM